MVTSRNAARRRGFTLIEIMVVIALVGVILALTYLVVPQFGRWQRATEGASQLQSWLMIAKNRALRDQAPRGLRLTPTSANTSLVTDVQFIEQPPDFSGGVITTVSLVQVGNQQLFAIDFTNPIPPAPNPAPPPFDFFNGNQADPSVWLVQPGDYLEIKGGAMLFRILQVTTNSPPLGNRLILAPGSLPVQASPLNQNPPVWVQSPPIWQYRIIRQPRVLAGEDSMQLPANVAIDLTQNAPDLNGAGNSTPLSILSLPPAGTPIDIMFSPSGAVIGQQVAQDVIILWVGDTTIQPSWTPADQTLVAIYTRTGQVASHPVNFDVNQGNSYQVFALDNRSSGQ